MRNVISWAIWAVVLQRGRTQLSAEGQLTHQEMVREHSASTGPHSIKCGRAGGTWYYMTGNYRLQRGRTQLSAEGRVRRDRARKGFWASTGPHSIKCGRGVPLR